MTKNRWQVIMPKRGSLDVLINHVQKHYSECIGVVITEEQLSFLEKCKSRLDSLRLSKNLEFRHALFRPTCYQTALAVTIPHTRQLERPERSGNPLEGYKPIYETNGKKTRVRSAKRNAKKLICEEVLLNYLGPERYNERAPDFGSNACFLYAYSNEHNLPRPGILVHCTQKDVHPVKYTGIVSSHLIREPGLVKLKGDQHTTYGSAVSSVFSLLDWALTELRLEQQFFQSDSDIDQLTQGSAV